MSRTRLITLRVAWAAVALAVSGIWAQAFVSGFSPLADICRVDAQCSSYQLDVPAATMLTDHGIPVALYAPFTAAVVVVAWLTWYGIGAVILWRRSLDPGAYVTALFLAVFPLLFASFWAASAAESSLAAAAALLSLPPFLLLFPSGRFVPRWSWAVLIVIGALVVLRGLLPWHSKLGGGFVVPVMLFAVGTQIYRFRSVSSWSERQQTKWAILGMLVAVVGLLVSLEAIKAGKIPSSSLYSDFADVIVAVVTSAIPISLGVAVLRNRLWDIDRVISRALAYTTLSLLLAGLYIGGVIGFQRLFQTFAGHSSAIAIALSTLIIAALVGPLRHRVQAIIDRRFYRAKYDGSRTIAAFSQRLRDEVNLAQLSQDMTAVVRETLRPEHVSLWLRDPAAEEVLTADGRSGG